MFFSKQKSIVGVDIGTSYIKLAQITHDQSGGTGKVLDTYGIVNTSGKAGSSNTDSFIHDTAALLSNLLDKARVSTKRCVASLPNSSVFTSVIDMPTMTESEMASAMQYEAKKYVPLPFSEVNLSWSVISRSDDSKTSKVLLIAVPIQVKENYIKLFELAGLQLEILEIEALALIRSLIIDTNRNSAIIDIGAKATGVNVVKDGLLQLTRNLNIGGDTITDRIAQSLNVTPMRAEQFKKDFGVSEADFLPESIKPVLTSIKNEVKQLLAIYQSHNMVIDNMVMVRGGSQLPGITDAFKDLGLPVSLGDPLSRLAYPKGGEPLLKRFSLQLPIAIGLALRNEN
jgi:type IV pilus assembly protein PilM